MTVAPRPTGLPPDRPSSGGLVDVIDVILDRGLVIDVFVRVSLLGLELLTVDARIVVASVDTYLRFAEAVNRLDLTQDGGTGAAGPPATDGTTDAGVRPEGRRALGAVKATVGPGRGRSRDEAVREPQERAGRRPPRSTTERREQDQ
ncbi:gas vesicle protein GvpJ [Kitasatospora sp. A2-31]|uniref:gas vesicle protein GvpJ n=1 Tax=Kitasatospora sp. A2-31 TaxID=2916414 RepID=UPI001EECD6F2|nr:gas vesicle protein GvpJ [Kitasatospora sp. A2-31]MCG6494201.1 gas vesicle protein [Kitasatospora sp. A2-31]